MRIRFWGVRGSIASPGPATAGVGGNTSCVEVSCENERFILDAGTGLRGLGDAMLAQSSRPAMEATLLLSHVHWDHIQGLPFFGPAYAPDMKLRIVGGKNGKMGLRETLARQMTDPVFPVRHDELRASISIEEVQAGDSFRVNDATVRAAKGNHPNGVLAYRIECGGRSVVYATDTEHFAGTDPQLLELARGADVLIYDSQYTDDEYRTSRMGWGHSTYVAGAELAKAAGVAQYILFHHDPRRNDDQVLELEARARELFEGSVAAREGMEITLDRA
ncbi:MBL fold metallo-hydrolase [Pendulispora brunnea]|uniref:MBL fold metallo-hydrolase n=1 Tax=Pendulispora brunnea TaxID=2905690 RepID=A0ABZ2K092_9BACT